MPYSFQREVELGKLGEEKTTHNIQGGWGSEGVIEKEGRKEGRKKCYVYSINISNLIVQKKTQTTVLS